MTLLSKAQSGEITKEMKTVAKKERVSHEYIRESIAEGIIVIPYNKKHKSLEVLSGIGRGLRTKVNANIGTSSEHTSLEEEIKKLDAAIKAGADTIMDLSTSGDIDKIRRTIIDRSTVPVGTVPIYQAVIESSKRKGIVNMTEDYIFDVIEKQA
ncbi:MAG: phosphomethylpyrimidine synthase ThiC, partial [Actinobacteria bacterium]|nr:phosphomethylpyrimidine synthase ThiC [Actinomycetota bacterium]